MDDIQNYFHVSPEKIQAVRAYLKTAAPITRACLVPIRYLIEGSYLTAASTNKPYYSKHNAYLSRRREQLDALLPTILQAAAHNQFKPIVDAAFPDINLSAYREEMMRHVSAESDAEKIYEFLSYGYKSNMNASGKGLILKELGFNGISAYKRTDGQIQPIALMDEPMRELITRDSMGGLSVHYAQMCQLMRS